MRRVSAGIAFCIAILVQSAAAEDSQPAVPKPSLEPQIYDSGEEHVWHRPPEVNWVIVSGCGAGAPGGDARQITDSQGNVSWGTGAGGDAAPLATVIVMVSADKYRIRLGQPTKDGAGGSTELVGDDNVKLIFPSGRLGSVSSTGESSPLGQGGAPGGLSPEGVTENGGNATGFCAGGGGSSASFGRLGGLGAKGYLAMVPLPDLARFARVLAMIEDLSKPPEVPPEGGNAQEGEEAEKDTKSEGN